MKKDPSIIIMILLLMGVLSFACGNNAPHAQLVSQESPSEIVSKDMYGTPIEYKDYEVVVIDSCEYLESSHNWTMVHKANCKNPIHRQNGYH